MKSVEKRPRKNQVSKPANEKTPASRTSDDLAEGNVEQVEHSLEKMNSSETGSDQ